MLFILCICYVKWVLETQVYKVVLSLFLVICLATVSVSGIKRVKAQDATVYIKADGSVEGTDKIHGDGYAYRFVDDVRGSVVVEKDDIILEGDGHSLDSGIDDDFDAITGNEIVNVTVRNLIIKGAGCAVKFSEASNCKILDNNIQVNETGVLLKNSESNSILHNQIEATWGIFLDDSTGNVISGNNASKGALWGIRFVNSSNNIFTKNSIGNTFDTGIEVTEFSCNNTITENSVTGTHSTSIIDTTIGVNVYFEVDNNIISDNIIVGNDVGLYIQGASDNQFSSNQLKNNGLAISIADSSNNRFRNNTLENNTQQISIEGGGIEVLTNDIDKSNTANGKPIYYLINQHNLTVPSDAGYIALINCTGITVQNMELSSNGQGVAVAFTTNSTIQNNNLSHNNHGIWILSSTNNTITSNNMTSCGTGIYFPTRNNVPSTNNTVANNTIANNEVGIWADCYNNTFTNNYIANNVDGIYFSHYTSNNSFYHNNFINNTVDVSDGGMLDIFHNASPSENIWDNGTQGNYWNKYAGIDSNNDGISDEAYQIYENNQDNCPLIEPADTPVIPEFSIWTIMPMLFVASVAAILGKRKLLKNA